jgi:hypothetical protein
LTDVCLIFKHLGKFVILGMVRQNSFYRDETPKTVLANVEPTINFCHAAACDDLSKDVGFYAHDRPGFQNTEVFSAGWAELPQIVYRFADFDLKVGTRSNGPIGFSKNGAIRRN